MDLTGWLEYFTRGLSVQMIEVADRGRKAIRKELISNKHNLSNRQELLVGFLLEHLTINIQDAEVICPSAVTFFLINRTDSFLIFTWIQSFTYIFPWEQLHSIS
jgi:hypothetical protein